MHVAHGGDQKTGRPKFTFFGYRDAKPSRGCLHFRGTSKQTQENKELHVKICQLSEPLESEKKSGNAGEGYTMFTSSLR